MIQKCIINIMAPVFILAMEDEYPFAHSFNQDNDSAPSLVQQTIQIPIQHTADDKLKLLAKVSFLKNLKNKHIIKILTVFKEHNCVQLTYQYVDEPLLVTMASASIVKLNEILEQMQSLAHFLSSLGVKIDFKPNRMGYDCKNKLFKLFIGLDFQWTDFEESSSLQEFYSKQIHSIFSQSSKKDSSCSFKNLDRQNNGDNSHQNNDRQNNDRLRKVSFATLPSRFNRMTKIKERLRSIHSVTVCEENSWMAKNARSCTSQETVPLQPAKQHHAQSKKSVKRSEDRKYSGEQFNMVSKMKPVDRSTSGIKSEYGNSKKKVTIKQPEENPSEIQTSKTMSRIDELKYKQYQKYSCSNQEHIKDFLLVLEEDNDADAKEQMPFCTPKRKATLKNSIHNSTEQLRIKAINSVSHARKVIEKFKRAFQN